MIEDVVKISELKPRIRMSAHMICPFSSVAAQRCFSTGLQSKGRSAAFWVLICAMLYICIAMALPASGADTPAGSMSLYELAEPETSLSQWQVGGHLGKPTHLRIGLERSDDQTVRVRYLGGAMGADADNYYDLYQRGQWNFSSYSHVRIRIRGDLIGQRVSLVVQDANGNWSSYASKEWIVSSPGEWKDLNIPLSRKRFPREDSHAHADLSNLVYVALRVFYEKAGFELDGVELHRGNLLDNAGFEEGETKPNHWNASGGVLLDKQIFLGGRHSLKLTRQSGEAQWPRVVSDVFDLNPGSYKVKAALRAEGLFSPDDSFNVSVSVEGLDAKGNVVETFSLGEVTGTMSWRVLQRRWVVPEKVEGGRFVIAMNKTHGTAWVDDLSIVPVNGPSGERSNKDEEMVITCSELGNLFLPEDALRFSVRLNRDAGEGETLSYEVRDYWGQRFCFRGDSSVSLKGEGQSGASLSHIDLSDLGLEKGVYYELHVFAEDGSKGSASFAVLPQSRTFDYPAADIPFGTQGFTWRSESAQKLGARLGARWSRGRFRGWNLHLDDPAWQKVHVSNFTSVGLIPYMKLDDGLAWERGRLGNDVSVLLEGLPEFVEHYSTQGLNTYKLGNEPPGWNMEQVRNSVEGYRALYEGIKQADPNARVISSSINNNHERFMEAGVGLYCDYVDFHAYLPIEEQRRLTRNMQAWVEKYSPGKPLWCTELGSNGFSLSRHQRAIDTVAKQVVIFADGVDSVDWFCLQATAALNDNYLGAFAMLNVDGTPRFDAISYFHLLDLLTVKSFQEEADWKDGDKGFLFVDELGEAVIVMWNRSRQGVVSLPLPGIGEVVVTSLDGRKQKLDARGEGIDLWIGKDPQFISFLADASFTLPAQLGEPRLSALFEESLVPGNDFQMRFNTVLPESRVKLSTPPGWKVQDLSDGKGVFSVQVPHDTTVETAQFTAVLEDGERLACVMLKIPVPCGAQCDVRLTPGISAEGEVSFVLTLRNNSSKLISIAWDMELDREAIMDVGWYDLENAALASTALREPASGALSLASGEEHRITVMAPDLNTDSFYRIRANVRVNGEKDILLSRWLGDFLPVVKARGPVSIDGKLDESFWSDAVTWGFSGKHRMRGKWRERWTGADDLSGVARFLWNEDYLYLALEVRDEVFRNVHQGDLIWAGDSFQFLVKPAFERGVAGRIYNYAAGYGAEGDEVWRFMSAVDDRLIGKVPDILFSTTQSTESPGGRVYEMAIPWSELEPFQPAVNAVLGLALIVNEDDGDGRFSWMSSLGSGVSEKQDNAMAGLILRP